MYLRPLAMGLITRVPGVNRALSRRIRTKDAKKDARYHYAVWLRHLVMARRNGLQAIPRTVAELGPGTTLGTGLAALLSGADKYYALDVVPFARNAQNVEVFDALLELFRARERIPDNSEWPLLRPELDSYSFPGDLLPEEYLNECTRAERVALIRDELLRMNTNSASGEVISYFAPWTSSDVVRSESVDMIIAQAVMEHVDDLDAIYKAAHRWLKKGGIISQEIDFSCHDEAKEWNGHWAYSDSVWKLIRGKRPFLINREPCSTHLNYLATYGFEVVYESRQVDEAGIIRRAALAKRFINMPQEDFVTKSVFIQAIKRR
jgi:SAM-dependent methyltransferase